MFSIMKRGDVIIQILHEVSGKPKEAVAAMLESFKATIPGLHRFDEEISVEEGERLIVELRKEKDGIAKWIIDGHHRFVLKNFPPGGSA